MISKTLSLLPLPATLLLFFLAACGDGEVDPLCDPFVAVSFNTGTSEGMMHDQGPDDGYTAKHAETSDKYYGDGLAWHKAVDAAKSFLAQVQPDVISFQEIFYSEECATIPASAHKDFICATWKKGDPTVAQVVLGAGYQVACHPGKPDKCAAVKRAFGSFQGCSGDFCLEGLTGSTIKGCGNGARVGRGVVKLTAGGALTLVSVHASSGITPDDMACRRKQMDQVFVDLGDGQPAASGARNIILGDFNTDPGRFASFDQSAARINEFVGPGKKFSFLSDVGASAKATYSGLINIDHAMSDALQGDCWSAGVTEGHPAVIDAKYFDHNPLVCTVRVP